jgi:hypothetical protein
MLSEVKDLWREFGEVQQPNMFFEHERQEVLLENLQH